jgi:hypothetical protein
MNEEQQALASSSKHFAFLVPSDDHNEESSLVHIPLENHSPSTSYVDMLNQNDFDSFRTLSSLDFSSNSVRANSPAVDVNSTKQSAFDLLRADNVTVGKKCMKPTPIEKGTRLSRTLATLRQKSIIERKEMVDPYCGGT